MIIHAVDPKMSVIYSHETEAEIQAQSVSSMFKTGPSLILIITFQHFYLVNERTLHLADELAANIYWNF